MIIVLPFLGDLLPHNSYRCLAIYYLYTFIVTRQFITLEFLLLLGRLLPTVGDDVEHIFQGPGCISKYRNVRISKIKIAIKSQKNRKKMGMVIIVDAEIGGCAFRVQCAFPNMESVAMQNEKWQ